MGQETEKRILRVYFENPGKDFTIREISNLTKIPRATVHKKLKEIKNSEYFKDELYFKIKKANYYIEKILSSGFIRFIIDELNPSLIILYGSFRKGESNKESDIDLFIESPVKKNIDFKKYEKKIGHKIDLFVELSINNLNDNLFNNVVNGIKLYGSFKVK
ncbi:MAG: nucleotidyltransferase domain-containing protein [Bacteroidetes bacterium]|nr:nucleotidyltransferase domain-containing protein [Bacteroidota bacterium]